MKPCAVFLSVVAAAFSLNPLISSAQQAKPYSITNDAALIADQILVADFSWRQSRYTTVASVGLTLDNRNKFSVKDVAVECIFRGKSGTELSKARQTVFDILPAGRSKKFKAISFGRVHEQAAQASCRVIRAVRVE